MRISRTLKRAPASSMAPQTRGRMYESMMCPRSSTSLLAMAGSFAIRGYVVSPDSVASAGVPQEQLRVARVLVGQVGVGALRGRCGGVVEPLAGEVALLVAHAPRLSRAEERQVAAHCPLQCDGEGNLDEDAVIPVRDELGPQEEDAVHDEHRVRWGFFHWGMRRPVRAEVEAAAPVLARPARPRGNSSASHRA